MYVFSLKFIILQRIPIYKDISYSIHVFFHLFVDAAKKAKGRKAGIINDDSDNDKGDDDDDDERLPPHELVAREYARSQRTTFSVCEGQGRTLKGRDLSRVRNAVWSQMGFAD